MAVFLRKYGVTLSGGTVIRLPMVKRGVVDFAVGADWTPASGDVKVSKDGGAAANIGTLPTAVAMGNGAFWEFTLTGTELSAKTVVVTVADSATKAVEDQCFVVETYGDTSAMYPLDLTDGVRLGLTALPNAAAGASGGLPLSVDTSGRVDVLKINGTSQTARDIGASVLLSSGTGTGQISLSSGAVLLQPTQTGVTIPTVTNLTNAPTSGDLTATMKTSIGTAVAASAVASVTGDVGGKVLGGGVGTITGIGTWAAGASGGAVALAATALSTATWTGTLATALTTLASHDPGTTIGTSTYAGGDTAGTTTLLTRLSATRAGYLDNLSGGAVMLAASYIAPPSAATIWSNGTRTLTSLAGLTVDTVTAVTNGVTLADGAITEAKISTPAETAGRPTGILGMIRRVWEWNTNKRTRDTGTGTLLLRNAADSATLETQTQSTAGSVDTQTKGV